MQKRVTDPIDVQYPDKHNGRTQTGVTTTFNGMNGPDWGRKKIRRSTTWTDQIKQVLKHQDGAYTTIINAIVKEAFK